MNADRQHARLDFLIALVVVPLVIAAGLFALPINAGHHTGQNKTKMVRDNLRQLTTAAQSYMQAHSLTQAGYADLVGTAPGRPLHTLTPVLDENYTALVISANQSQITLSSTAFGTITYSM